MAIVDGGSLSVALFIENASPYEIKIVLPTLRPRYTRHVPQRPTGDKAYDSDSLRKELRR